MLMFASNLLTNSFLGITVLWVVVPYDRRTVCDVRNHMATLTLGMSPNNVMIHGNVASLIIRHKQHLAIPFFPAEIHYRLLLVLPETRLAIAFV